MRLIIRPVGVNAVILPAICFPQLWFKKIWNCVLKNLRLAYINTSLRLSPPPRTGGQSRSFKLVDVCGACQVSARRGYG